MLHEELPSGCNASWLPRAVENARFWNRFFRAPSVVSRTGLLMYGPRNWHKLNSYLAVASRALLQMASHHCKRAHQHKELRRISRLSCGANVLFISSGKDVHICVTVRSSLQSLLKRDLLLDSYNLFVRRVTAVQFAANLRPFHCFVSTLTNPADKRSRWVLLLH